MATTFGTKTRFDTIQHNENVVTAIDETTLNAMKDRLENRVKIETEESEETLKISTAD